MERWHSSATMVGAYISQPGENAMSTVWSFLVKFASLIVWKLDCFDRVIFEGHLAMASVKELERFVDYGLRVRGSEFIEGIAPQWSERLVELGSFTSACKLGRRSHSRSTSTATIGWRSNWCA